VPTRRKPSPTLRWLFGLEQFGIKLGLENIRVVLTELGNPERSFRSVLIAGTNGKGSVAAMLDAALAASGRLTGRYTSPHLVDLAERFALGGAPVNDTTLDQTVGDVRAAVEQLQARGILRVPPTFFEVTTAAAFLLFKRARVDAAICEVGLGGRLDATNVLEPNLSVITSIGLDHRQQLGETRRDIAREKAGIIKPKVPVVVGALPEDAMEEVAAAAGLHEAPLIRAFDGVEVASVPQSNGPSEAVPTAQRIRLRTPTRDYGELPLALAGAHQVANAVVAVRALEALPGGPLSADDIATGLASVRWPGRLDLRRLPDGRTILLDAAHNEDGARALAAFLDGLARPRPPLVFGVMRDKDVDEMLRILLPAVSAIVCTRATSPRSADPAAIAALAREIAPLARVRVAPSVESALAEAWRAARFVVAAGSIFLLGEVLSSIAEA
jgi:dihydrofolate synthase/folylpolyglutamate synthase